MFDLTNIGCVFTSFKQRLNGINGTFLQIVHTTPPPLLETTASVPPLRGIPALMRASRRCSHRALLRSLLPASLQRFNPAQMSLALGLPLKCRRVTRMTARLTGRQVLDVKMPGSRSKVGITGEIPQVNAEAHFPQMDNCCFDVRLHPLCLFCGR